MKVILLKDVKKQGKKGDVIEVSDGYGRNYLIKNNLAKVADGAALNQLKSKKEAEARLAKEELAESKEIKEAIEKQYNIDVDRRKIQLGENLNSLGRYNVPVKLHSEVSADIKVHIVEQ